MSANSLRYFRERPIDDMEEIENPKVLFQLSMPPVETAFPEEEPFAKAA